MPTPNDMLVVGRDRELARLGGLLESDRLHCGVVVTGAVGIGRTTVWEAGLAMARQRGLRVLAARPAAGAAKRSFAALIDLCDGLGPSALAGLPREQRAALDVALLRAETRGESFGPRAACLGFVSLLRALAAESPLLIAIDDAQWLDAPSSHAIALAAHLLRDEPVGYLLTRRAPIATPLEQRAAQRIDLGPLSTAAIRGMLTARHGLTLRRHLLHRVVELTQGNPSLALEMGRLLIERGLPAIGAELPVPDAIEDVSGTNLARLPEEACRLLVAVALKADLEKSDLSSIATSAAIDAAVEAGLLRVDGEQVRASHPLLALAVKQRSCASLRRAVRNALAGRDVTHVEPDPRLAATRAAQASAAAARSERLDAVHLAEQALRLTPAGSPLRGERLLALADHLALAGEPQRLRDLLTPELGSLPTGPVRARAWLLLSEPACHASRDWDQCEALLDAALAESAGDSAIRASVLLIRADRALSTPAAHRRRKRWRGTRCRRPAATSIARHGSGWRGRVRSADLRSTRARPRRSSAWSPRGSCGAVRCVARTSCSDGGWPSPTSAASRSHMSSCARRSATPPCAPATGAARRSCSTSGRARPMVSCCRSRSTSACARSWRPAAVSAPRRSDGRRRRSAPGERAVHAGTSSKRCGRGEPRICWLMRPQRPSRASAPCGVPSRMRASRSPGRFP